MNDKVPYKEVKSLAFDIYRPEEVRKLSVLEIINPNTFDELEHPVPGGLYDPRLGPNEKEESCETCGLRSVYCPGHLGHISLPLPVFHPVFIKTLYQILQGSCFTCYQLLAPSSAIILALYQFQALDCGLVGTVQELAEAMYDPTVISANNLAGSKSTDLIENKLKTILDNATKDLDLEDLKSSARVKNVVECRQRVMKNFIRTYLCTSKRKCPHCGTNNPKMALRHNTRFIYTGNKQKIQIKQEPSDDFDEERPVKKDQGDEMVNMDLTPSAAKKQLTLLWKKEKVVLQHLFGVLCTDDDSVIPTDIFFMEVLLVSPLRFRPISVVKGRKYLNPQSTALKDVLTDAILLRNLIITMKGQDPLPEVEQNAVNKIPGKNDAEKLSFMWHQLQNHVNCVYDSDMDKLNKDKNSSGVKQILEKKEGLFRKHMMGKRVNYAARSVISPDPYIMVDEIGVPTVFAKKLTYPQPVTDWNVEKLRINVLNGPNVHPGAEKVQMEDGSIVKLSDTDCIQRHAIACKLLTPPPDTIGARKGIPKIVHRHLQNGDVLLLNRQPTLHKPSIMAHRARVLQGEKTLRLHYANCKSYNADFDGDEMNAHFPQSELARSEGYNIVSVNHQYLVPKDGTPLSGLIQDHIIAGTLLTIRGNFFPREDYQQMLYGAISFLNKPVKLLPPAIMKPYVMWSGKQIVSTLIINIIPEGKPPPTVEGKTKVSVKNWQTRPPRLWTVGGTPLNDNCMSESEVVILSGELLCGVIDKAHIGPTPYGLIHCCNEIYGGETSTALLTSLARLFTIFLQMRQGFSLGIEDILLTDEATRKRRKVMYKAKKVGDSVLASAFDVDNQKDQDELISKYKGAHLSRDDLGLKTLDYEMKKKTDSFNNDINGICMPNGLMKKFPQNNLQLMVESGAKGSTVNCMQISCLLGQIELEGRRVPLMMNGSTLPSFLPYDSSPRAGGFVDGRFLTGIRPQEFFFHCMAGREGLVDTAVKTSRSGYLQRCLIKHLEGLHVNYDLTVRDSDGSVIQFLYGEDGLDIGKMQMLKENKLHLLAKNYNAVMCNAVCDMLEFPPKLLKEKKSIRKWRHKDDDSLKRRTSAFLKFVDKLPSSSTNVKKCWYDMSADSKQKLYKKTKKRPDPVTAKHRPHVTFGSVSEKLDSIIENYIKKNHNGVLSDESDLSESGSQLSIQKFKSMNYYRAMQALAQPGEAVGLLAAQSVGEPSTQMTLNTFHFAGRGEMNVTLGIPRLREILMVASANIATPSMDLPLYPGLEVEAKAEKLKVKLSSVYLKQVLQQIDIKEVVCVKRGNSLSRCRKYIIRMTFLPHKVYKGLYYVTPQSILDYIEKRFLLRLIVLLKRKLQSIALSKLVTSKRKSTRAGSGEQEGEAPLKPNMDADEGGTSDEDEQDGDTVSTKSKSRHNQETEYEEPEAEEKVDDPDKDDDDEPDAELDNVTIKQEVLSEGEEQEVEESDALSASKLKKTKITADEKALRIRNVLGKSNLISKYDFDDRKMRWCEFTLELRLQNSKIDMRTVLENEASSAVVYSVPNIKKAFIVKNPDSKDDDKMLKTDGVNFLEIFGVDYVDTINGSKVYSNDIHAIANIFGIEAAARVIVKEIMNVFAIYGIEVDPRHLLLIADYMTFDGTYKPCNRVGMASNASPLQQMTFETTMAFLQAATLTGSVDQLKSPSARLVLGQLVGSGTGCIDVFLKPQVIEPKKTIKT